MSTFSIALHGGAGTILRSLITAEQEQAYRAGLDAALAAGYAVLAQNGSALDAVRAATVELENNILFNAGRGAVFGKDGSQELDASIMDGKTLEAGAVAAVKNIPNPVELAYAVMKKSPHVLLIGKGANDFASHIGMDTKPDDYFFSEFRHAQWQQVKDEDGTSLDHNVALKDKKFGTVGAVACDVHGNLAAATSTGGMTNKQWGRVGDSAIIGAGTYANNNTCAVSCTGHGELFIRGVVAYDVSCLMEYKGLSLKQACAEVVYQKLPAIQGAGGLIAIDKQGNIELCFNSEGMYRAMKHSDGRQFIGMYQ